jgi:hypothetical protein
MSRDGASAAKAGGRVLLIPGFLSGDGSLATLAARLAAAGHHPLHPGIVRNVDCSEAAVRRLIAVLEHAANAHDSRRPGRPQPRRPVRPRPRAAQTRPGLGRRDPRLAHARRSRTIPRCSCRPRCWAPPGRSACRASSGSFCATGRCRHRFRADLAAPLTAAVGSLAIYSRQDGVVQWRACVDHSGGNAEVFASHCGMLDDAPTAYLTEQAIRGLLPDPARSKGPCPGAVRSWLPDLRHHRRAGAVGARLLDRIGRRHERRHVDDRLATAIDWPLAVMWTPIGIGESPR